MNTKKGDVWVSAILYFGLGIIVLTIILSAGTPIINRLRDKNIVIQTKEVMHVLDSNIREVAREGPGSQRPLTVDIRKGDFLIDLGGNTVNWTYRTKALLSEPGVPVKEGTLNILTEGIKGDYTIKVWLHYDQVYLVSTNPNTKIVGRSELMIRNGGLYCVPAADKPHEKKESTDNLCTNKDKKIGVVVNNQP